MSTPRDDFLHRVRQALAGCNCPREAATVPPRGTVGYQGAGPDLAAGFRDAFVAAGGRVYLVPDRTAAAAQVLELIETAGARRVLLGRDALLDSLALAAPLRARGIDAVAGDSLPEPGGRALLFAADLAVTGVDYLIAETGSLVLLARPEAPRSLSLLPPVHIAVAERRQLLPDLFDLFEPGLLPGNLPSCVTLITGPSKTGDIELRLVTGVHGPGEVHVVLVGAGAAFPVSGSC